VQLILDFAPGAWTPPHTHGGAGLVTVLEGELTRRDDMTGEETVYAPGEFWIEVPGHVHAAGNAGQENARAAVTFLLPKGASLTTVKEGTNTGDLPPGPTPAARTAMTITEGLGNFEAIQLVLDFAPGTWTPPHSHGGPVLVTILEGQLTLRDDMTGEETTYAPGEFWIEEPGYIHAAGNAGQENARAAVIVLLPTGASQTTAKEGINTGDLPPGPTAAHRTGMPMASAAE
jgi:quercetin dioxygenase-like cupin family protein